MRARAVDWLKNLESWLARGPEAELFIVRHGGERRTDPCRFADLERSELIGLVVQTGCRLFEPLAFPDVVEAGVRVASIGRTSVRYEVGLFKQAAEQWAAEGHFVHVYVERNSGQPADIPSDASAERNKRGGRAGRSRAGHRSRASGQAAAAAS